MDRKIFNKYVAEGVDFEKAKTEGLIIEEYLNDIDTFKEYFKKEDPDAIKISDFSEEASNFVHDCGFIFGNDYAIGGSASLAYLKWNLEETVEEIDDAMYREVIDSTAFEVGCRDGEDFYNYVQENVEDMIEEMDEEIKYEETTVDVIMDVEIMCAIEELVDEYGSDYVEKYLTYYKYALDCCYCKELFENYDIVHSYDIEIQDTMYDWLTDHDYSYNQKKDGFIKMDIIADEYRKMFGDELDWEHLDDEEIYDRYNKVCEHIIDCGDYSYCNANEVENFDEEIGA